MSVFSSIVGGIAGLGQSAINYDAQIQNLNYQKDLQKQIFAREDNAVQRRAEDLQKAGLSKTLAAGDAAGAGAVVNTKAPQTSVVDDVLNGMSVSQMQANVKHTQAQTENLLMQNKQIDSNIEFQNVQRAYTMVKMSMEQGLLDMLPMRKQQLQASIDLTRTQIRQLDEAILSSQLGRRIDTYKYHNILPLQAQQEALQIGLLRKQGAKADADIAYRNMEADLLAYNITSAMYLSQINKLDYMFQSQTGLKPSTGSNPINLATGLLNSNSAKDLVNKYVETAISLDPNGPRTYKEQLYNRFHKDKTPK